MTTTETQAAIERLRNRLPDAPNNAAFNDLRALLAEHDRLAEALASQKKYLDGYVDETKKLFAESAEAERRYLAEIAALKGTPT